jgi:hypothetical protein
MVLFIEIMTEWAKENPEMVEEIKNRETGYEWPSASSVITECNTWHEENFPSKAPYIFKPAAGN